MEPGFHIESRSSAGNLHVNLSGDFNGICAWALYKFLSRHGHSKRVFVNTRDIGQIADEGIILFKLHMTSKQIPKDWLYFKGRKGFFLAPDGSRVLICNPEHTSKVL